MIAAGVYGVLCLGFVPLAVLGALGGAIARWRINDNQRLWWIAIYSWSILVAFSGVFALAVLDKFIGYW